MRAEKKLASYIKDGWRVDGEDTHSLLDMEIATTPNMDRDREYITMTITLSRKIVEEKDEA